MLGRLFRYLHHLSRHRAGTTLIELSVSLVVGSTATVGLLGAVAVGAVASSTIEGQDRGLMTARSQMEYVFSLPSASTYPIFPDAPEDQTIVITTGDPTCPSPGFLQCIKIQVFPAPEATGDPIVLEAFKAKRFVVIDPTAGSRVVPPSSGLDKATEFRIGGTPRYYLHNDPTPPVGDTASHAVLSLDGNAPTATQDTYDTDRSNDPELEIRKTAKGIEETAPRKHQVWRTAPLAEGFVIEEDTYFSFFAATANFNQGLGGEVTVFVRDRHPDGTYTEISSGHRVGSLLAGRSYRRLH